MVKVFLTLTTGIIIAYTGLAQTSPGKPVVAARSQSFQELNDEYWYLPGGSYEERRTAYIDFCSSNAPASGRVGIFAQLARMEKGLPLDDATLKDAIEYVYSNADCNDFTLGALLRIMYLHQDSDLISEKQKNDIEKCLLDFIYWYDEPGSDGRCYWTENHQIIFHSDELLAGQLYKDKIFTNNRENGSMHMQHALSLIEKWMNWRIKLGFSEWLAHSYFEEDLMALVNLHDFAEDPVIRAKAGLLIDVLLFEMALHNYHGVFGSTHGRTYAFLVQGARGESSASTMKLMFGMGVFNSPSAMGTISLATSSYKCPEIIQKIAADYSNPVRIRERHSMNVEDAFKYDVSYYREPDVNLYWSIQDYTHPAIIDLSQKVANKYRVWLGGDYDYYRKLYEEQLDEYGKLINVKLDPHAMTEVNIETYRTADYMLSCAQQFRPGAPGYQQHPWQATLGIDATVFTNHPGSEDEFSRPNYWAGNGILPNAAQFKNVLICIYNIPQENPLPFLRSEQKSEPGRNIASHEDAPSDEPIPFSHAYFPKDAFDEVICKGNWIFGRKDKGYIALYSQNPTEWKKVREREVDLIANSRQNIWICEMGSQDQWKNFRSFVSAVSRSKMQCEGLNVKYTSPSAGEVQYGWSQALKVKGETISQRDYLRFDNPWCRNEFASDEIVISRDDEILVLDFRNAKREYREK
ncbi:MAG TPA: hypothetical protein PLR52_02230 [Bacteroidales bacterium]|nr:hypothetical protein [Bacteroidales bacterium]HPI67649.1 hypothetical protein [Bacteroidales bacterium]HPR72046.1 hypothetical protein [Bacteroidales bacterium]